MALFVFGAGTLARMAVESADELGSDPVEALVVDDGYASREGETLAGRPVVAWSDFSSGGGLRGARFMVAVGYRSMRARADVFSRLEAAGVAFFDIVSPHARVSRNARLGRSSFVMAGAVVESAATLGDNNVLWSNCTICHDARVGHHNFFAAGVIIGGHATVGDRSFFGFGSIVRERRHVGHDTLLGASALLLQDTEPCGKYVGLPATRVGEIDPRMGVGVE